MHSLSSLATQPEPSKTISYVLGFCFNENRDAVSLILKNKPDWQKGFYNGIGGKIEPTDESPKQAMIREFKEETGLLVNEWRHYCTMGEQDKWTVYVFRSIVTDANFYRIRSAESEAVACWPLKSLPNLKMINNLTWLIPLALDSIRGIDYKIVVL